MDSIFYFSMQSNFLFQCLPTSAAVPLISSCAWESLAPGNAEADIFLEPPEEAEEYREELKPPSPSKTWRSGVKASLVWEVENEGSGQNCIGAVACSGHLESSRAGISSLRDKISLPSTGTLMNFSCALGRELVAWLWAELGTAKPAIGTSWPQKFLCKAGLTWNGTWLFSVLPSPSPLAFPFRKLGAGSGGKSLVYQI